jgi:Rrf2 family protein
MRLELTKRGDYAVRAMLALTRGAGNGLLSARRISDAMDIPVRFLPQVLADLQRAGLIEAAPGRAGGYRLSRDPEALTLLEVIEAVEGDSRRVSCVLRGGPCGKDGFCDVHDVFFEGQEALRGTFARSSMADLARHGLSTVAAVDLPTDPPIAGATAS